MNINMNMLVRGKGGEVEVTQVAPGYRIVPSSVTARKRSLIIIVFIYMNMYMIMINFELSSTS